MTHTLRWIIAGAVLFAAAAVPTSLEAQVPAPEGADWQPIVFSYVLRQAGARELNPFGSTGRREVLQLMVVTGPREGRFRRVRMDRIDGRDTIVVQEGWYRIQGRRIVLQHMGADGRMGEQEVGGYFGGVICMADGRDGRRLRYTFTPPDGSDTEPPAAPGGADPEACPRPAPTDVSLRAPG